MTAVKLVEKRRKPETKATQSAAWHRIVSLQSTSVIPPVAAVWFPLFKLGVYFKADNRPAKLKLAALQFLQIKDTAQEIMWTVLCVFLFFGCLFFLGFFFSSPRQGWESEGGRKRENEEKVFSQSQLGRKKKRQRKKKKTKWKREKNRIMCW